MSEKKTSTSKIVNNPFAKKGAKSTKECLWEERQQTPQTKGKQPSKVSSNIVNNPFVAARRSLIPTRSQQEEQQPQDIEPDNFDNISDLFETNAKMSSEEAAQERPTMSDEEVLRIQRMQVEQRLLEKKRALRRIAMEKSDIEDEMAKDRQFLGLPTSEEDDTNPSWNKVIQQFAKASVNDPSLIPAKFTGKRMGIDSLNRWIEQFNKYARFKRMDDATKMEFFKLLMVDEAADWMTGIEDDDDIGDFDALFERFRERFLLTDIQKWQQARSVWQRQQGSNESVDQYITWIKNRAKNIPEIDEKQLPYIVISGLKPEIRKDVLKAKHDTLDDIKKAARISEIAERESGSSTTIADLERTIALLVDKLDQKVVSESKPTTPQVLTSEICRHTLNDQPEAYSAMGDMYLDQQQRRQSRNPIPRGNEARRLPAGRSFTPPTRRPQQWQQNQSFDQRYASPNRKPMYAQARSPARFDTSAGYRRQQSPAPYRNNGNGNVCAYCGTPHQPQGQCPARGNTCYNCNKIGHFARVCRSAPPRNNSGFH